MNTFSTSRNGVVLRGIDYGGTGPTVLLLHGLAGHAGEWSSTAARLRRRARVIALDTRGHGHSDRNPRDVSLEALNTDVIHVIERLSLGRVIAVGQSLGGRTALLLAASRPDLVRGLVIVEADPEAGTEQELAGVDRWLRSWPAPFPTRASAEEFFGGSRARRSAWADGLADREGGLWPRFEADVMTRMLAETLHRPLWDEWERIGCPTLVVRATDGELPIATAEAMVERSADARLVEVVGGGHDLHLASPDQWEHTLTTYLDSL